MNTAYFCTWVPRSHMHLRRLHHYLTKQNEITIAKSNYNVIKSSYNCELDYLGKKIGLTLDDVGVMIYETTIKDEEVNNHEFLHAMFSNLNKKVFETTMPIIKHQIDEGLMPLQEQLLIKTSKKIKLENYETFKIGNSTFYTNRGMNYSNKIHMVLSTQKSVNQKFLDLYFFIKAYEHALLDLSEKMSQLYKKTLDVNKQLENEHMDIESLKEITRYLADKTKDVSLMHSRLKQMQNNYEQKHKEWKYYRPGTFEKQFIKELAVDERYENVTQDTLYIQHLWELLGEFLDRSLNVLEIVTSRQDVIETNKLQALASTQTAQILAASILSIVVAEGLPISPRAEGVATLIIWGVLFLLIMGAFRFFSRNKKVKKIKEI